MLKKLTNKKGFTLMEMLIVVAIIAVLVAIAIPTFNGALTKSKESADVANIRAYYAQLQIEAIDNITTAKSAATNGAAFVTEMEGKGYQVNFDDKVTYTPSTGVIEYSATKITAADGTNKFTWTLGDATA